MLLPVVGMVTSVAGHPPATQKEPSVSTDLRCEYLVDPLGIDATAPRLSWEMVASRRGAVQQAYRILVADELEPLNADTGNLWDSGKVISDQSIQVVYGGEPLRARMRVWWKVRVWDQDDQPSPWSEPARWTMGLLEPSDWQANWIGDITPPPPVVHANNGYHSELASSPDATKWVAIDLGESATFDAVKLYPARPYNWKADVPGFLFPRRFKIEVSDTTDFAECKTVVDRTSKDVPAPNTEPQAFGFPPATGRFVRLTTTGLRLRNEGEYGLALAEMEVLGGGKNLALGKTASASDSIEQHAWSVKNLVDGDLVAHGMTGLEPLPAPLLRKTFELAGDQRAIERATLYATALGLYELRLNGRRVGDHLLAPEWTDYRRRVQYQTYDVTDLLRAGDNALGALLGDGWYAGEIGLIGLHPGRARSTAACRSCCSKWRSNTPTGRRRRSSLTRPGAACSMVQSGRAICSMARSATPVARWSPGMGQGLMIPRGSRSACLTRRQPKRSRSRTSQSGSSRSSGRSA